MEKQTWAIRKVGTNIWLHSHIDSAGMEVWWGSLLTADIFDTKEAADSMAARARDRYAAEKIEVIPHH